MQWPAEESQSRTRGQPRVNDAPCAVDHHLYHLWTAIASRVGLVFHFQQLPASALLFPFNTYALLMTLIGTGRRLVLSSGLCKVQWKRR